MSDSVLELRIVDGESNLFSSCETKYVIPLYQRAFAWEDKEILQLIDDIYTIDEENYYIGSLIVDRKADYFEVIDGQQRLTALFLLLNALGLSVPCTLTFACRDKSNYTLQNINSEELLSAKQSETSLLQGKKIIDTAINSHEVDKKRLLLQLQKVILYRIEVPKNTDLNRYFEIMNTRGEQLEQHDILKATLMSHIKTDKNKHIFAEIWNACSDMTGYVQMHFGTALRNQLFGDWWENLPRTNFNKISIVNNKTEKLTIRDIIKPSHQNTDMITTTSDEHIRFESIITFPYFLLHVLKVYVNNDETIVNKMLDDKKLLSSFRRVIDEGVVDGKSVAENKEAFALGFISCLLKCRFLFDKFILKREFRNEDTDGVWSLKQLKVSGSGNTKKAYYTNTAFARYKEWKTTYEPRHKYNLMLQSCLRVSYTSPKAMHWITELLLWLYDDKNLSRLNEFEWQSEGFCVDETKKYLTNKNYNMGVDTPHIVLNYIDYLLWAEDVKKSEKNRKYNNFVFEFRNSVEHWYPQQPSEGTFDRWTKEEGLDDLGNLCLVQRNVNSKFSNLSPEAKKTTFEDMISKGSLKLRVMAELTVSNSNHKWKENICKQHQQDMLAILENAVAEFEDE